MATQPRPTTGQSKTPTAPPLPGYSREAQPPPNQPPRHPAQPPEAKAGYRQPDQQPQQLPEEEEKPEREVAPEEALQLFRAGHKLKKAGDPPEKWFAASRLFNQLVLCVPVDEDIEKRIAEEQLVLAE